MNKITVIGTGSVGSTIAYTLAVTGIASEIVMVDINEEKALGEALDIRQGIPFCGSSVSVYAGSYRDAAGSDIVVLTSGVARKPGQSRLDLTQTKYADKAVYVIVSNPVDILTYVFMKCSDIPENRIIGSGTILDTARLRSRISEYYNINQKNVHAYVFGEHGDSSFVPWSIANISNIPIDGYADAISGQDTLPMPKLDHEAIEDYMRKSGGMVISRKGATYYAIAVSVTHICDRLLQSINSTMTVSSMMHGEYGIDDVCLSTLSVVGHEGYVGRILYPLNDNEVGLLRHSADCLKDIIKQINI